MASLRALFPRKVLIVTEFGGEADPANPSDALGGLRYQARLIAHHIALYCGLPALSGMLVFALRDYAIRPDFRGGSIEQLQPGIHVSPVLNEKGLFDYAGRPRPSVAAASAGFGRIRASER